MKLSALIKGTFWLSVVCGWFSVAIAGPEFVRATTDIFAHPHDLELDPSGRWVFIADVNHHSVNSQPPFNEPKYLALDGDWL